MISIFCQVDFQPMKKLLAIVLILVIGSSAFAADEPQPTTLVWPDGTKYIGSVVDGKRNGKGTIFWLDGTRFVGIFKNDMRNGAGSMILPDGTVYNGHFENDVLVDSPGAESTNAFQQAPQTKAHVELAHLPAPVTALDATVRQDLIEAIDLWAAAWSEKNVTQYLASYDKNFSVPRHLTRRQWEVERRRRLKQPRFIALKLIYRRFEITATDTAEVRFQQTYKSNLYTDVVDKVLQMKHADGSWTILSERES